MKGILEQAEKRGSQIELFIAHVIEWLAQIIQFVGFLVKQLTVIALSLVFPGFGERELFLMIW